LVDQTRTTERRRKLAERHRTNSKDG
jgi:hypothetical protein